MAAALPEDRPYASRVVDPPHLPRALHPLHAILLASTFPLWLGAVLADWAYRSSQNVQWINFASWLVAGAMVFSAFAFLWSLASWLRWRATRRDGGLPLVLLLLAVCVLGFIDALVHAKDAWAVMPEGLVLSVVVLVLTVAAHVVAFSSHRTRLPEARP